VLLVAGFVLWPAFKLGLCRFVAGRKLENEKRAVHSHRHSYLEQVQIIIAWYISQTLPQPPTTA